MVEDHTETLGGFSFLLQYLVINWKRRKEKWMEFPLTEFDREKCKKENYRCRQ
jgi:hypothetical protein